MATEATTSQQRHMVAQLEYCRREKMTLAQACYVTGRKPAVVKNYCRAHGIALADWAPRNLKESP